MHNVAWVQAFCCGGETVSLLNAEQPTAFAVLGRHAAQLLFHPSLVHASAGELRSRLDDLAAGRAPLDILVVEGALEIPGSDPKGDAAAESSLMQSWVSRLAEKAAYVVAVGTCASFGGLMRYRRTGPPLVGLQFTGEAPGGFLGTDFRSRGGLPVVNVPGCPAHPDWITGVLGFLLEKQLTAEKLDRFNRPRVFFSRLAHHACPRNEYYEFKASATEYSQQGCLFENLGCKGTQCESDCNERLWLARTGSCPRGGFPCVSCTSPKFPEGFTPFFRTAKIGDIPTTLPLDVPKAWYVGISGLSKLACPRRLSVNAVSHKWVDIERTEKQRAEDADV